MVAYGYKARFVTPMRQLIKRHTIRLPRKNPKPGRIGVGGHAVPGEQLQHYCAMRTKNCYLIGLSTCTAVHRITIELTHSWVEIYDQPKGKARRLDCYSGNEVELDPFAKSDGFASWTDMWDFWAETHGHRTDDGTPDFDGFIIEWGDTFRMPQSGEQP